MNKIGFKPLGARVLVSREVEERKDAYEIDLKDGHVLTEQDVEQVGSLFIPKQVQSKAEIEFKKNYGTILSLGTGLSEDAKANLKVGTKITFRNPHIVAFKGTEYNLVHENNIELILDE